MLHLFVFQNKTLPTDHVFDTNIKHEEVWLDISENQQVHSLLIHSDQPKAKGLIVYFHGNAGNLNRWSKEANKLTSFGYDVLAVDYPGYGKSPGKPSEAGFYATAQASMEWVSQQDYAKTVVYGRSLGSAVALYTASNFEVDMTILETTFYDMPSLVKKRFFPAKLYYPKNEVSFPNHAFMKQIESPIHILQGDRDRITPVQEANKLLPLLKQQDSFTLIKGGTHKNLATSKVYQVKLTEIL